MPEDSHEEARSRCPGDPDVDAGSDGYGAARRRGSWGRRFARRWLRRVPRFRRFPQRRSHSGGSHGNSTSSWHGGGGHGGGGGSHWGGGRHGGGRIIYSPFFAYPYWGWGYGWGWGFGPDGFFGYYGPYGYSSGSRYGYGNNADWTVVDTDVSPEEARVFLDGRYVGTADDFDGHPDYLYLRPGAYSLEFRLEGYESATVSVNAKPGVKVNLNNKLKKMPGAKQYGSYDTPQPEGGLQRYFGKKPDGTVEALDHARHDGDGFHRDGDRWDNGRGGRDGRDGRDGHDDPNDVEATPDEVRRAPAPARGGSDLREDEWRQSRSRHGARLLLVVHPADAAVYLDDRFIGTADEVGGEDQAVPLSTGKHSVTVSRPGYKDKTVQVEVLAGEVKRVDVTLQK